MAVSVITKEMLSSLATSCCFVRGPDLEKLAKVFQEAGASAITTISYTLLFAVRAGFECMSDLVGADTEFLATHAALDARLRAVGVQVIEKAQAGARG